MNPEPIPGYVAKLLDLGSDKTTFPPGTVSEVAVMHDDDCEIWDGKACNCEPDFRIIRIENE